MKPLTRTLQIATLAVAGILFASAADAATIALTLNSNKGTTNPNGWSSGFAFTVTESITVTELGKFDHEGDGLGGTDVGLYNVDTGALLASASLVGATAEAATGTDAYFAAITPLVLTTGTEYAIMAVTNSGEWIAWNKGETYAPQITYVQGRANSGSTLTPTYAQTHTIGSFQSYSGGTFKYETAAVPEPASLAAGLVGLTMIVGRRRK